MMQTEKYFSQKFDIIADCKSDNFVELVKAVGLDPAKDFVGADLAGVDFSNCDLRGFNFVGANLEGSYGINVQYNSTTNLKDAIIKNSIFGISAKIYSEFENETDENDYQNLKRKNWYDQALWVTIDKEKFLRKIEREKAIRLFFDSEDLTVKTNILLSLRSIFKEKEEYKNFLVQTMTEGEVNSKSFRSTIIAAANYAGEDSLLFNTLCSYVPGLEFIDFNALAPYLINSRYFPSQRRVLIDAAKQVGSSSVKKLILRRLSHLFKLNAENYLRVNDTEYVSFDVFTEDRVLGNVLKYHLRTSDDVVYDARRNFRKLMRILCFYVQYEESGFDVSNVRAKLEKLSRLIEN